MPATDNTQYCTFWLDGLYLGVAVDHVQEVLCQQQMTLVRQSPKSVRGLLNLRGQIVTAIDLRRRLGLPERSGEADSTNVVIRSRGEIVSLLVDDIGDVIDTANTPVRPVPATVPTAIRAVALGVIALPQTILLVLDADLAADVAATHPLGETA